MFKLTESQIENTLTRIPYGKRVGECIKCLKWYSENIRKTEKEFIPIGLCEKCTNQ